MSCLKNQSKPKLSLEGHFKNPNIENIGQAALANAIHTTKSAISRLENHAEDIRLSTLDKVANALGKTLKVSIN